ncbi:MAG: ABC transporter permease [Chitinophagaceae bacterium]|jgi:ABC-2 type transport system permease protein
MSENPHQYRQFVAMLAIAKASLKSIFRSPSAVIFSFLFPIIFILVFGFLSSTTPVIKVAFAEQSSNQNELYSKLLEKSNLKIKAQPEKISMQELEKGHITAILNIKEVAPAAYPKYVIEITTSTAAADRIGLLQSIIQQAIAELDLVNFPKRPTYAFMQKETLPGREYRTIDFILPGQLGFSLLSAGVFGVAFIFFNLRQTLVLKRFFATPIKRTYIVFGEGLGRIAFQMITAVVILSIGHFAFKFTLVNQWVTFIELMVLSLIGLIVFMGFGFIVSGLASSESTIPPFANLVTLPQFLLAGTFFPVENFPSWLQPLCNILPLTHLNQAMRNVAFEGAHLTDCGPQLQYLLIWGIVLYAVAIRVFRWE